MKFFIPTLLFTLLLLPVISYAQSSTSSLINIPVADNSDTFGGYINTLYYLAIAIAAILAVIKLIIAGVKYMLTDVVTSKADAKNDIKGALLGLLLIISAVLILTVINENIIDNEVDIEQVSTSGSGSGGGGQGPGNNPLPSGGTATTTSNPNTQPTTGTSTCSPVITTNHEPPTYRTIYNFQSCSPQSLASSIDNNRSGCVSSGGNFTCSNNICTCTIIVN